MKKLKVTIQLDMSVPDDWELSTISEGGQVLKLPNAQYLDRPLPDDLVAFSSARGRDMLASAMAAGDAAAFFPLVSHLHTQAEPV